MKTQKITFSIDVWVDNEETVANLQELALCIENAVANAPFESSRQYSDVYTEIVLGVEV